MTEWMADKPGTEGLAEWYELAIADDDAPEAKPALIWEWGVILAFIAVFWIALGLLLWGAVGSFAGWLS